MFRLGLSLVADLALVGWGLFLLLQWLTTLLELSLGEPAATAAVLIPFALVVAWLVWRMARAIAALRRQYAATMAKFASLKGPFAIGGRQYDVGRLLKLYLMWRYRRVFPWWMR